ncbi:MAG: DUF3223 domain-containing protein [Candidatus Tenebribacter burtonii]|nr:DUF3223 domain-containing protein [Candidatus Tenebribacter burtonii]
MKHELMIGKKLFASKKEALEFYKSILNSYNFGESLKGHHFTSIFDLYETHPEFDKKKSNDIIDIKITKSKYNNKCFEFIYNDGTKKLFSYTKRINLPKNDFTKFSEACRQAIQEDLIKVKQTYFRNYAKNGKAKCQETGELLKYDDLCIDHRQPNTFSIILDRFIELNDIDLTKIEYLSIEGDPDELKNVKLKNSFNIYHKKKSTLRIVNKCLNSKRSFQARVKRQKKDLTID